MWNSDESFDSDMTKKINDMSESLNLSTKSLQQFMSGNISVGELAATRPTTSKDKSDSSVSTSLNQVPNPGLFPAVSYESPSFSSILSSSSQSGFLQPLSVTQSSSANTDSPFRSPPFVSDSSSLMELSTVTPSRIKNSPSAIVAKGIGHKTSASDAPSTSSKLDFYPPQNPTHASALSTITSMSEDSDNFKIVIGDSMDTDQATSNYFVNLESVSKSTNEPPSNEKESGVVTFNSDNEQSNVDVNNDEQTSINNEAEMDDNTPKRKRKDTSTKLPKDLRGLMGEANLAYARGAHEDAIKMCMEVVRQAPYAAEPYDTLSMIYDEKGENGRALQYSLLAAHLSKTDAGQWLHLASLCISQGDKEKAIDCYSRAAKARPTDCDIHLECAKLCIEQGHLPKAILHYKAVVMLRSPEEGAAAVEMARSLSKMCHNESQNVLGISLLEQAFDSHPHYFTDEDANLLCELYLMEKQFSQVFKLLVGHSELQVKFNEESDGTDFNDVVELVAPDEMAVDLMCKVATAAIQMGKAKLIEEIVKSVCSHSPSDTGDIQYELAEAYIAADRHTDALIILDSLVTSRDYGLAGVWLRHGECHRSLGNIESAMNSYRNCVRLAPGHVQAHLLYSKMLRKAEKYFQACQTLDVAENYEIDPDEHVRLYFERYKVNKIWGEKSRKKRHNIALAGDAALVLFTNKFKTSAFKEGKIFLIRRSKPSSNPTAGELRLVQLRQYDVSTQPDLTQSDLYLNSNYDIMVTKEKWIDLFNDVIGLLVRCRRFKDAISLAEGMQYHNRWHDHLPTRKHFEHVSFICCILGEQYQLAYSVLSPWIRMDLNNNNYWNFFNQLIAKTEDQRHQKFCLRLLIKNPRNLALVVMAAHNWMASGFYKTAVGEYMYAHRQVPSEPLYMLLIGIAFINLCSQKFTDFKHSFVTQALAYFEKYQKIRGLDQESYYNIGRGMHQLGLEHFAIHYYEKALNCERPAVTNTDHDDLFCLRREIAFNLSLIYRKSGNILMACEVIRKHCSV